MIPADNVTAAICAVTGVNGSGKTLFTIDLVERYYQAEKAAGRERPLYYWGIRSLNKEKLPHWKELETFDENELIPRMENPIKCHEVPKGAIVVCDEAQNNYGKDIVGEPDFIKAFATCRWRGVTFFMISQTVPSLHPFVRGRIGKHWHLKRVWGREKATVYEWEEKGDPSSTRSKADALKDSFDYPKHVYEWYNSADQHNIKKSTPWKMLRWLAILPVLVIAVLLFAWWNFHRGIKEQQKPDTQSKPAHEDAQQRPSRVAPMDGPTWAAKRVERVFGQPSSPALYDEAIKVVAVPKISGCSEWRWVDRVDCVCNTQQGTRITTMTYDQCHFYLKNGWFDPMKPDEAEKDRVESNSTVASADGFQK